MARDFDPKMLGGMVKEIGLYLPKIRAGVARYSDDTSRIDALEEAYRFVSTIRGAAAMIGIVPLKHLAYYVEERVVALASGTAVLDSTLNTWVHGAVDHIEAYVHGLIAGELDERGIVTAAVQSFRRLKGLPEDGDSAEVEAVLDGEIDTPEVEAPASMLEPEGTLDDLGLTAAPAARPAPRARAQPVEAAAPAEVHVPVTEEEEAAATVQDDVADAMAAPALASDELLRDDLDALLGVAEPEEEPGVPVESSGVVASGLSAQLEMPEAAFEPEDGVTSMEPATEPAMASAPATPGELDSLVAAVDREVQQTYRQDATTTPRLSRSNGASMGERYIVFTLAEGRYAVAILHVLEVSDIPAITPIPNVPEWLWGVINLRGEILSIIDFRTFLGAETTQQLADSRMLVVKTADDEVMTSLIVDRIEGIVQLATPRMDASNTTLDDKVAPYMTGLYEHNEQVLAVLDLDRFLLSPEICQFQ